jgi:hypothetical protein
MYPPLKYPAPLINVWQIKFGIINSFIFISIFFENKNKTTKKAITKVKKPNSVVIFTKLLEASLVFSSLVIA